MSVAVEPAGYLSGDLEDVVKKMSKTKALKILIFRGTSD